MVSQVGDHFALDQVLVMPSGDDGGDRDSEQEGSSDDDHEETPFAS